MAEKRRFWIWGWNDTLRNALQLYAHRDAKRAPCHPVALTGDR